MQYGIDWLVIRADLVFGLGWLGVSDEAIERMSLELTGADGSVMGLPASRVRYHDVVSPILRKARFSGLSGFIVYGTTGVTQPVRRACLRVELEDGEQTLLDAPFQDLLSPNPPSLLVRIARRRNQVRKAWALARRLMFSELMERTRAWRSRAASLEVLDPVPFIEEECVRLATPGVTLIIDHTLGGGANRYREELMCERRAGGGVVGVISFNLPTLQYSLEVQGSASAPRRFALASLEPVLELARRSLVSEVFFNNAVSFPNPQEIPALLTDLKEIHGVSLSMATHDYFALCPSPYLLDSRGSYCDLPEVDVCRRCLPENRWVLFGHGTQTDIEEWRARWGRAFAVADNVYCFSDSSSRLLRRVFPSLSDRQIQTRPHVLDDPPAAIPSLDLSGPLRIGVVGTITYHKGSHVVVALAERIKARDLDIRVAVLGTLDEPADPQIVSVTGRYRNQDLPRLVERSGVNLMFLPSIVPETFSYVASELMHMELPVACFDIGAPAERVSGYSLGRVIALDDPDTVLDRLIEFHDELESVSKKEVQSA